MKKKQYTLTDLVMTLLMVMELEYHYRKYETAYWIFEGIPYIFGCYRKSAIVERTGIEAERAMEKWATFATLMEFED